MNAQHSSLKHVTPDRADVANYAYCYLVLTTPMLVWGVLGVSQGVALTGILGRKAGEGGALDSVRIDHARPASQQDHAKNAVSSSMLFTVPRSML